MDRILDSMKEVEKIISGWGNIPRAKTKVVQVSCEKDDIAAIKEYSNIIPRGLGRSYADQSTNEAHFVLDIVPWKRFLHFDEEAGILECESGCSLDDIIKAYAPKGWFPMISPGTKFVTIGGAIANDVHGKAHHVDGTFINCVKSFKILLADGSIVKASREVYSDLFYGAFGGLGLLGVILSAEIQLRKVETCYFTQKSIPVSNIDELLEQIDANDKLYNYSVAWVDSLAKGEHLGRGVLIVGNATKREELPPKLKQEPLKVHKNSILKVPFYMPSFTLNAVTVRTLNALLYWKQKNGTGISHYDSFFYPLDMVNDWNKGYGKKGFIQYQFVVPLENGKQSIREILYKIAHSGCNPFLNVLKKFGDNSGGILSFPKSGYTFAIDFPITRRLKAFTVELDRVVYEAGGRLYLGKDAYLTAEMFQKMYPEYKQFLVLKKKYDPNNVWQSDLSRRLALNV